MDSTQYFANVIEPLRTEALAILGPTPGKLTDPTLRRIHECAVTAYVLAHENARARSLRYGTPHHVVRTSDTFHPFSCHEVPAAQAQVLATYMAGERVEAQACSEVHSEEEPQLSAAELAEVRALLRAMIEEEERDLALAQELLNDRMLELDWLHGYVQPAKAPLLVLVRRAQDAAQSTPSSAYCELPGANKAAWLQENGLLWEALRLAGLSPEAALRHAGASLVLGFEVSSYRVLKPRELRAVRQAVEAGLFYSNWSLIEQASQARAA